jgi:site-specific DNA recombinase
MSRQDEWTRETEVAALAHLRLVAEGGGPKPVVLAYTRQSASDFDKDGRPRGPSLHQQLDSVTSRAELQGLPIEHYQDADRSGKETSKRPDYLRLIERVRNAAPGAVGAVAFYDQDRFHRNDVEFFLFMAEMTERHILVFDSNGVISNVDKLSWKIKAIVAQDEREKVARRVRDNLRFLKRDGHMLGVVPQGYMRVDGEIVEDPEAGPIIRDIFKLYATGEYSVRSLAEHLNSRGIRPRRGPNKARHNRPAAVIFTGDVIKDILTNQSYRGKVEVDGELVEGKHPPLVDEATWTACADVRTRNLRRTSKTWTKHSYPLTPLLRCGICGSPMHGEASKKGSRVDLYYACHNARRNRSAVAPRGATCAAKFISVQAIEEGIREELRRCLPTDELHQAYRDELWEAVAAARRPETLNENAVRRLGAQLDRVRRLFELGEYDEETFIIKRSEIRAEQDRLREQATALQGQDDTEWCRVQLFDMLSDWDAADGAERTKLLASLFEQVEAHIEVPGVPAVKFRTKREAETVGRLLADRGHDVEWVRRNHGAQRELTWNIRLADGSEIHNHAQLAELGLVVPGANQPAGGGLKVVAVPRDGWRRFFEYVVLERETGLEPATSTLGRSRSAR